MLYLNESVGGRPHDQPGPHAKISIATTMSSPIEKISLDIPDDLTIPQFFGASHVSRPSFSNDAPCLVDDQTGRTLSFTDVSAPTLCKATHPIYSPHSMFSFSLSLCGSLMPFI